MRINWKDIRIQQTVLVTLLLIGLGMYFVVAWSLYTGEFVTDASNVDALHRAGLHLYVPYIGLALGGIFGVNRLRVNEVDVHIFLIAFLGLVLWDALGIGNLLLARFSESWAVEDVVRFSEETMQVLSILPAAAIGYYFGAQSGQPGKRSNGHRTPPNTAAVPARAGASPPEST
ncbi:MAG TPA: hypothetical protein VJ717_17890 [Gemmatimonadaceae bacterium]|nr:hypothetical protein [Gemmatimonadaceae bacterium]